MRKCINSEELFTGTVYLQGRTCIETQSRDVSRSQTGREAGCWDVNQNVSPNKDDLHGWAGTQALLKGQCVALLLKNASDECVWWRTGVPEAQCSPAYLCQKRRHKTRQRQKQHTTIMGLLITSCPSVYSMCECFSALNDVTLHK